MHTIIIPAVILYNFVPDVDLGWLAITPFLDFEVTETHETTYNIFIYIYLLNFFMYISSNNIDTLHAIQQLLHIGTM